MKRLAGAGASCVIVMIAYALAWGQDDTRSLSGVVVRSDTNEPVGRAEVVLNAWDDIAESYVTRSRADGSFTFTALPIREYRLTAQAIGYLPFRYSQGWNGITVNPGSGLQGSGLRVPMIPAAAISGRVRHRNGEPAQGAMVQALTPRYVDGRHVLDVAARIRTDDLGQYRFGDLQPGEYYVGAVPFDPALNRVTLSEELDLVPADLRRVEFYPPTYFPDVRDIRQALPVALQPGERSGLVDIFIGDPVPVRRVRGVVIDASTGAAMDDVQVSIASAGTSHERPLVRGLRVQDGVFETLLPAGEYILTAHASRSAAPRPGIAAASQSVIPGRAFTRIPITIMDSNAADLVVPIRSWDISVQLSWENAASAASSANVPLRILLTPDWLTDQTDASIPFSLPGEFTVPGISPGAYRVRLDSSEETDVYLQSIALNGRDISRDGSVVQLRDERDNMLSFVFSARGGVLEGIVEDERLQPLSGALVALTPEAPWRDRMDLYKSVRTDRSGRFRISGIAPGEYRVYAWEEAPAGAWLNQEFLSGFEMHARPVIVTAESATQVRIEIIPGIHH